MGKVNTAISGRQYAGVMLNVVKHLGFSLSIVNCQLLIVNLIWGLKK